MTASAGRQALRAIPSVDRVLRELGEVDLPRPVVLAIVRRELEGMRGELVRPGAGTETQRHEGTKGTEGAEETKRRRDEEMEGSGGVVKRIRGVLETLAASRLRPVINATGVIIHTNLGRSPLAPAAIEAMSAAAAGYTNLEFDLAEARRGGRGAYLELLAAVACEAEAATVVNNCAAALVLMLHHFCRGDRREVVISRGELVQIGGGFRVPEILESAGAVLCEVGTTNRTTLADYERAIGERTGLVLKVHRSNFWMEGFVESPATEAIARVAKERGVVFVEDLGSGWMGAGADRAPLAGGLGRRSNNEPKNRRPRPPAKDDDSAKVAHDEPTPAQVLRDGASLVCFSGDKLLGGPQAGIIAGSKAHIAALKAQPLFRALRCDKLTLAALEATLELHLAGQSGEIPVHAMMHQDAKSLRNRAEHLAQMLVHQGFEAAAVDSEAQVGGGAMPRTLLPSAAVDLTPSSGPVEALAARLRLGDPPVVGHITGGRLRLDLRTVPPEQDDDLARAVVQAMSGAGQ